MPYVSRRADLLERSLPGRTGPRRSAPLGTDPRVSALVATAGRIPVLGSRACSPRPEFVETLGLRLRAEALALPVPSTTTTSRAGRPSGSDQHTSATGARRPGRRPVVLVVGGRLPRILAGGVASLLVVAGVVGGTSRSALPGGLLYPVKQLLNHAAVQLSGDDFDRGVTLLSQGQEHISEAAALVDRDGAQADPASVDAALMGAYDAVEAGQRGLLAEFDRTANTQALIAVQDFVVRSLPQLNALRRVVPPASRPDVDRLLTLLQETRSSLAREVATCGQPCASMTLGGLSGQGLPTTVTGTGATAGGLPAPAPTAIITGPVGVIVGPSVSPVPVTSVPGAVLQPPVTIGSVTLTPTASPTPTPSVVPGLSPLPLPLATSAPVLLPPPTVLPSLP